MEISAYGSYHKEIRREKRKVYTKALRHAKNVKYVT